MNTTQPEVVEPRWVTAAQSALGQHRYLSQEKKPALIGWHYGPIYEGDMSLLEIDLFTKKRFIPIEESHWEFLRKLEIRAGTTCRWCPSPMTDGYERMFPTRCKDCGTLNSYRQRGRNTARKLLAIKYSLDLESILWTFTFPIVESNRPLEQDEIETIAKERRRYISKRLFQDKEIWHDKFVGINVMESVVTAPGETREARYWDDDYERVSNMWTYHIHGHYLILNPKDSRVNLELAYAKFGKSSGGGRSASGDSGTQDESPVKMRLYYKHENDYDRRKLDSNGEVIGTRDEMKIMRDYLVGYARKDCLGKYAWVGDRTWRKVRTARGEEFLDDEHNYIGGTNDSQWVKLGLLEEI